MGPDAGRPATGPRRCGSSAKPVVIAKPIDRHRRLTPVKGRKLDMVNIDWNFSSNADRLVAVLLAVTVLFALV